LTGADGRLKGNMDKLTWSHEEEGLTVMMVEREEGV
jgi:hypothetical protein